MGSQRVGCGLVTKHRTSPEIASLTQDKRGDCGWWFGTSEGSKAIHTGIKRQIFGKQMFAGPMGHRVDSEL